MEDIEGIIWEGCDNIRREINLDVDYPISTILRDDDVLMLNVVHETRMQCI